MLDLINLLTSILVLFLFTLPFTLPYFRYKRHERLDTNYSIDNFNKELSRVLYTPTDKTRRTLTHHFSFEKSDVNRIYFYESYYAPYVQNNNRQELNYISMNGGALYRPSFAHTFHDYKGHRLQQLFDIIFHWDRVEYELVLTIA